MILSTVGRSLRGTAADMLETKGTVVHTIGPKDTVYDAIAKMSEKRVGALLVMQADDLVGIVSERDYTRKVILVGRLSKDTLVEEIMTRQVLTVEPETTLTECLRLVTESSVRHLPVMRAGRLVGVLSIGDLVRAVLEQQAETIQSLSSFIGSDYPT
jgi:CBS domain-containing protein